MTTEDSHNSPKHSWAPDSFASGLEQASQSVDFPTICTAAKAAAEQMLKIARDENRTRFILSGSGDSLFAARSTARALRLLTGLDIRVLTSIDCARYELHDEATKSVLIAISNSGGSARTREAVALAEHLGVPSLAIVGSADGPLAKSADLVLHRPVGLKGPAPSWSPRVFLNAAEYLSAMVALFALGLHIGVLRGTLTDAEADVWRGRVRSSIGTVGPASRAVEPAMRALAGSMRGVETLWVLGAGPSRGSAEYSAAKFHEQVPLNGIPQDLEEWAHLQYFLTLNWGQRAVVLVLAPRGRSVDRAAEIVRGIAQAGGRAILVTDDAALAAQAGQARKQAHTDGAEDGVVLMPPCPDEVLSPLSFHVPAQLLALHLARTRGVGELPLSRRDDRWLIRGGKGRPDPSRIE